MILVINWVTKNKDHIRAINYQLTLEQLLHSYVIHIIYYAKT